jgi:hypothetical protein
MITKNIIDKGIYIVSMVVEYRRRGGRIDNIRAKRVGDRYVIGNVVDATVVIKKK